MTLNRRTVLKSLVAGIASAGSLAITEANASSRLRGLAECFIRMTAAIGRKPTVE